MPLLQHCSYPSETAKNWAPGWRCSSARACRILCSQSTGIGLTARQLTQKQHSQHYFCSSQKTTKKNGKSKRKVYPLSPKKSIIRAQEVWEENGCENWQCTAYASELVTGIWGERFSVTAAILTVLQNQIYNRKMKRYQISPRSAKPPLCDPTSVAPPGRPRAALKGHSLPFPAADAGGCPRLKGPERCPDSLWITRSQRAQYQNKPKINPQSPHT